MKEKSKISRTYIYFFDSFGGILFGYDIGVMTGVIPFIEKYWQLSNELTIGWITSSVMFGAIFGSAIAGKLSDYFGRQKMILMSSIIFLFFFILFNDCS